VSGIASVVVLSLSKGQIFHTMKPSSILLLSFVIGVLLTLANWYTDLSNNTNYVQILKANGDHYAIAIIGMNGPVIVIGCVLIGGIISLFKSPIS